MEASNRLMACAVLDAKSPLPDQQITRVSSVLCTGCEGQCHLGAEVLQTMTGSPQRVYKLLRHSPVARKLNKALNFKSGIIVTGHLSLIPLSTLTFEETEVHQGKMTCQRQSHAWAVESAGELCGPVMGPPPLPPWKAANTLLTTTCKMGWPRQKGHDCMSVAPKPLLPCSGSCWGSTQPGRAVTPHQ